MAKSKIFTLKNTAERNAALLGISVIAVGAAGITLEGTIYSPAQAIELIDALGKSALYLGTAIAGSSGTILALMLTLIGFVRRTDSDFDIDIYRRINLVGILSTVALIGAVLMLLLLTLPVVEYEEIPTHWYKILYRVQFCFVIGLSAVLVANITILYGTVRALIANITPSDDI